MPSAVGRRDLWVVQLVIGGEQLAGQVIVAVVVHLLVEAADQGFVLSGHRCSSLFFEDRSAPTGCRIISAVGTPKDLPSSATETCRLCSK